MNTQKEIAMFEQARYIQNSFTVTFARQPDVRRKANHFEDLLRGQLQGHYGQPQVIPVPDELDPEIPRLIFGSRHGFSQIIISQISATLNVVYSPDWQIETSKGREYLLERTKTLFSLLEVLDDMKPYFSGLITRARLATSREDKYVLDHLNKYFLKYPPEAGMHDLMVNITAVRDGRFYSNMAVQNYRLWKSVNALPGLPRLSRLKASERGIEVTGDFNDRYTFNEQDGYFSSHALACEIINGGFEEAKRTVDKIQGSRP